MGFSDDFNRADNVDLGANWDSGYTGNNNLQIVGNRVRAAAVGAASFETTNATLGNNQTANATLAGFNLTSTVALGRLQLRAAAPATYDCYEFAFGVDTINSRKCSSAKRVGGLETIVASDNVTAFVAADIQTADAKATALRLYRNGVLILSTSDSAFTGGRAGMRIFIDGAGTIADVELDDFSAFDDSWDPGMAACLPAARGMGDVNISY